MTQKSPFQQSEYVRGKFFQTCPAFYFQTIYLNLHPNPTLISRVDNKQPVLFLIK